MAEGILTEREWRKQALRGSRAGVRCWGAQCVKAPRPPLSKNRCVHAGLIMLSFSCALLMPFLVPAKKTTEEYRTLTLSGSPDQGQIAARSVSAVEYSLPAGESYLTKTYSREELLRGKLLFIDGEHPLPKGVPAPNTMSIATCGKGMVPVSDLGMKSGKETITALTKLFAALRGKGAGGYSVCRATMTPLEQREWRLEKLRTLAAQMPLKEAVERALLETDTPGAGELLQEYTVELSPQTGVGQGTQQPLSENRQRQILLQTAWRYGFIQASTPPGSSKAQRFRYVGEAHATAMTYLDLTLQEYLELLHKKRVLQVRRSEQVSYLILCQPMSSEYVEFTAPEGAVYEASLDNMGYAVMACTLAH